jgi:hypothetical protein
VNAARDESEQPADDNAARDWEAALDHQAYAQSRRQPAIRPSGWIQTGNRPQGRWFDRE